MLCINDSSNATCFLSFSYRMNRQRGFTTRFRSINFDNTTTRKTTYAQSHIQTNGTRGNNINLFNVIITHFHNGTTTMILFNFIHRQLKRFQLFGRRFFNFY